MGIDLYLEKPTGEKELLFLKACLDSLLGTEQAGGFRGVQSKSLVDLIQLECLSGSSALLKITNGKLEGRIWIQNGDLIDAEMQNVSGEDAFKKILAWKTGNFEIVPMDAERPRKIFTSYQGLLLDTAQALDEAQADSVEEVAEEDQNDTQFFRQVSLGRIQGVELALKIPSDIAAPIQKWGVEDPGRMVAWMRGVISRFQSLNPGFEVGAISTIEARSPQRILHATVDGSTTIVVGMLPTASREQVEETTRKVVERWAS
jgi:hypothetical protein